MDHQSPHISPIVVNNPLTLLKKIRKFAHGSKSRCERLNCGGIAAKILDQTVKRTALFFNNRLGRFAKRALLPAALLKVQAASANMRKLKINL
jgi:hypothetical protein